MLNIDRYSSPQIWRGSKIGTLITSIIKPVQKWQMDVMQYSRSELGKDRVIPIQSRTEMAQCVGAAYSRNETLRERNDNRDLG